MDIISLLPDDLLIQILSLVPRKHVPATSLLSKRWQFLWILMSELEFDDSSHQSDDYNSFTQFVYRSLLTNKAPELYSLHLKLGHKCEAVDIGIWIDTAIAHHVHVLIIEIYETRSINIRLPSSLYTCETLEILALFQCIYLDIPFSVCLPSLKVLCLADVDYADKGSLPRLLSGCPKLEQLLLEQDKLDVALVLPSLKILEMKNNGINEKGSSGFVIDAPSLKSLTIQDEVLYDFHRIENMPNLEDARVEITHGVKNHKFLKAFTSARSLNLCLSFSKVVFPSSMIFPNLVDLVLNTCAQGWWDLLTHMLQYAPKLEFLKLNDEHDLGFSNKETPDCWTPPSSVPECLMYSLKAFKWNGYKGRQGDRNMATYILANATRLKKATFSPESKDVEAKYQMLQDLACVATPSPWLQLFFK